MKVRNQQILRTAGAGLFLILAGCGAQSNSTTKDVHAEGVSGSGKSAINLEFYPIKNGQIQMERCVRQFGRSNKECKTYCTDADTLRRKLNQVGGVDTNAVMNSITSSDNKSFGKDFKDLQKALLSLAESGQARECVDQNPFHAPSTPRGITKKTSPERRNNPSLAEVADSYTLMPNGDFFRDVNGIKCQITSRVEDFKVSSHPKDAAFAYFIKGSDLWIVNRSDEPAEGQCPKTVSKVIMKDVKRDGANYNYWVTSSIHTTVVNSVLSSSGEFTAWDNNKPIYQSGPIVVDVDMNQCFGVQGKSFNSYVAFLLTPIGSVIKVKGDASDADFAKEDFGFYSSLNSFRKRNDVCN